MTPQRLLTRIRLLLIAFIAGLAISGLTAFPLVWEVNQLAALLRLTQAERWWPALAAWIGQVQQGLSETAARHPFLFYGTDWLAFAHIVIAVAFIGPMRDPLRNIWVIEFGLIACCLILPMVLIFGPLRGIPPFWQVIDASFGVVGAAPLWLARRSTQRLERMLPERAQLGRARPVKSV